MSLDVLLRRRLGHTIRPELASRFEEHLIQCLGLGETLGDRLKSLETSPLSASVWKEFLPLLLVPKTEFYRHAGQLRGVERYFTGGHGLKIWSAGCATGEEVYTLALLFGQRAGDILGSDVSEVCLERARDGFYPRCDLRNLPPYATDVLQRGEDGSVTVPRLLKQGLRFKSVNLAGSEPYPIPKTGGLWDVIFCRNVLIYFDREEKERVIQRMADQLAPEGLLVLSPAEALRGPAPLHLEKLSEGAFAYRHPRSSDPPGISAFAVPIRKTGWARTRLPPLVRRPLAAPESAAPEPPTPTVSEGRAAASCPIALQIEEAERLEKRGELGSAVSQLQKASEAADLDSDLHWRIGRAYRRMGKTDLAGVSLRRVLLLSPNQWAAALQLAGVLFEQEDFAASEREYGRAQRILESTDGVEPFYQEEIRATCRRRVAECRIRLSVR